MRIRVDCADAERTAGAILDILIAGIARKP
jgi:hypothetical protein